MLRGLNSGFGVEFVVVVGVGGCRFVLLWLGWRAFLGVFYGLQFGVFCGW